MLLLNKFTHYIKKIRDMGYLTKEVKKALLEQRVDFKY